MTGPHEPDQRPADQPSPDQPSPGQASSGMPSTGDTAATAPAPPSAPPGPAVPDDRDEHGDPDDQGDQDDQDDQDDQADEGDEGRREHDVRLTGLAGQVADAVATLAAHAAAIQEAHEQLAELAAAAGDLGRQVERTGRRLDAMGAPDNPDGGGQQPSFIVTAIAAGDQARYGTLLAELTEWVHTIVVPIYVADVTSQNPWCAHWMDHPEAVALLHGAYLAYNDLCRDTSKATTAPSAWHRDHLEPALARLRASNGPLARCKAVSTGSRHEPNTPAHIMPLGQPPAGAGPGAEQGRNR